jgi:rubrerythrin
MKSDRLLTQNELVRAIRFSVAAEYEAVQVYTQLAESTDSQLAREVLLDIADEERVHAGEFMRLLQELAPDEASFYAQGAREVEDQIEALKGGETALPNTPPADAAAGVPPRTTIGSLRE